MSDSPYRFKSDPHSSHAVILRRLGAGHGRSALDVGAADGYLAERLTAQGWQVTALEADPAQAARAQGRCARVVVADLEDATVEPEGSFDAIVFGDVLEHLSDPAAVLARMTRALAPGGLVVVSVPNVAHLWVRLNLLLGRWEYQDRGILDRTHLRFFTRRSLGRLLGEAGLALDGLAVTPVPLPLVVPERAHGRWLDLVHGGSALLARGWPGGLAYQFVAFCRPAARARERARTARAEAR